MSVMADISNISRCSLHDGPGLRTVVYFKGCGMRCRWCHNPETFVRRPEIMYAKVKCIHCGKCIETCPEHHRIEGDDMVFDREGCAHCGRCAEACPSGALSVSGEKMSVEDVMAEVLKDKSYYDATGGGITISGGECMLQADFAHALLKECHAQSIHTTVESACFVPWENIEKVLPEVDLFYGDLKIADADRHREYTGQENGLIIENLRRVSNRARRMIIRMPMIPGVNDSAEEMAKFGAIIRTFGPAVQEVELLRYNSLAESKYRLAGMEFEGFGEGPQTDDHLTMLCEELRKHVPDRIRVFFRK